MIRRRWKWIALATGIVALLWFALDAGRLLVIDVPVANSQWVVTEKGPVS